MCERNMVPLRKYPVLFECAWSYAGRETAEVPEDIAFGIYESSYGFFSECDMDEAERTFFTYLKNTFGGGII